MKFQVVFTFDEEYQGYVADVPELPGCMSQGKTLEEAKINIRDAIIGVLQVMKDNNLPYQPSGHSVLISEIAV